MNVYSEKIKIHDKLFTRFSSKYQEIFVHNSLNAVDLIRTKFEKNFEIFEIVGQKLF